MYFKLWHLSINKLVFTECMQTAGNVPSSSIVSASSLPVNKERTREVAMLIVVRINWNINVSLSQHSGGQSPPSEYIRVCLSSRLLFELTQEESNELNHSPCRRAN